MRYCCVNCFNDTFLKDYIQKNNKVGNCNYCNSININIISTRKIGEYIRECLDKAYEDINEGTGAYFDSEDKKYYDYKGEVPQLYSVYDILTEKEDAISDSAINTTIINDIFEDSGLSYEDRKYGDFDTYEDIEDCHLVIRDDLYGQEITKMHYAWEIFKYTVKHYNRFFDMEKGYLREDYLHQLQPYIMEYEQTIPVGTVLYRAREQIGSLLEIDTIDVYKELAPAPPKFAKTNRMSPAGISYLYLASDIPTTYAECRYKNMDVIVAEYVSKVELTIIDFSQKVFISAKSIFSEEYDHDLQWVNIFLENFIKEISHPVDENKTDHSYEYVSTQIVAEYIRSLGYDGICFNSSVSSGKSYVFFCGPDMEHSSDDYDFEDEYLKPYFPNLNYFTEWFNIQKIKSNFVYADGSYKVNKEKLIKN